MSNKGHYKIYTLDDGTTTTAQEVAAKVGVTINNARTRLSVHSDPAKVWQEKQYKNTGDAESYKMRSIRSREASMYNEMFVLMMKNI